MTKVYVAKTENTGKGLFAKTDIKKNEAIFSVQGRIIKESKYYAGSSYKTGPRWLTIGKNTWISPLRSNPWWFINHSCKPNAGLRGKVTVVAMKNIKKGNEITIDYSITEDDPFWQMKCECSHNNCRKAIRSVRFLPWGIFRKYEPFIPKFLQESYLSARTVH